jgi:uncharacterized protein
MIVVSDASPLINLFAIGELEILRQLYGKIVIPEAVHNEIVLLGRGKPGSKELDDLNWIEKKLVKDKNFVIALTNELDKGEAESIALAVEYNADLLLIDEKIGRRVASRFDLNYIGLLGVIVLAKRRGIIENVEPLLKKLSIEAGFWIKPNLYRLVLSEVGENKE